MSNFKVDSSTIVVPRILMLDAAFFDTSINALFKTMLEQMGKQLTPGVLTPIKAELNLLVDGLLFWFSIGKSGQTFGQRIMNLKYAEPLSPKTKAAYAFLTVVLPYLKSKYQRPPSRNIKDKISTAFNLGRAAQLLNTLIFIRYGIYPSVTERLLRLNHTVDTPPLNRAVAYNFLIRELLYHSFTDLIVFSVPSINWSMIKSSAKSAMSVFRKEKVLQQVAVPEMSLDTRCAVCDLRPYTPCRVSIYCVHIACYICLQGNLSANNKFRCPSCDVPNTASEQLQYIRGSVKLENEL